MIIRGKVIHAETNDSIEGVSITIKVDDIPFFEGKSIEEGLFEKSSEQDLIGAMLHCRVEMDGFEIWEHQLEVETEKHEIQVALKPMKIELQITISDQKGNSLEGAKINLKSNNTSMWKGVSNSIGKASVSLDNQYRSSDLNYKVESKGFKQATGTLSIEQDRLLEIKMAEIVERPKRSWIWPLVCIIIGLAFLVIGIVFSTDISSSRIERLFGYLFIILSILMIIFALILRSRKKVSKSQITGTVIAKSPSSQSDDSGFLVIKEKSGKRRNINIEIRSFAAIKIGDTVSFRKTEKANEIAKDFKVVKTSD